MAEILAPAGSEEAFEAALRAGADAVYLGGSRFGARAYADNFDENTLIGTIRRAHLFGKKIYLTVNTLIKEEELDDLYSFILPYYRAGLDAVIVQDLGAVKRIRDCFPGMHIHASTQMTVTGCNGASFLRSYGVDRVVPARELSLKEIKEIKTHSDIEVECFVHGALCYCYSGQCLMSSLAGGRSGNRGRCAQPCRLPYTVYENGKQLSPASAPYALNTKDICTLEILPELLEAGVDSFKIEGRMKRPEYTAGVTAIYRKYLDLARSGRPYQVEQKDRQFLFDLFNREGFSESYYRRHNGPEMMALHNLKRSEKDNEKTEKTYAFIRENILTKEPKKELAAEVTVTEQGARLVLEADNVVYGTESDAVFPAKTKALTADDMIRQIQKTGGTAYTISVKSAEVAPDLFMTVGAQKELRRQAIAGLEEKLQKQYERETPSGSSHETDTFSCYDAKETSAGAIKNLAAYVNNEEQYRTVRDLNAIDVIYVPAGLAEKLFPDGFPLEDAGKKLSLALPAPLRSDVRGKYEKLVDSAIRSGAGFLAGSFEEMAWLLSLGLKERIRLDANVYIMNSESAAFMKEHGITKDTVPYELNRHEIKNRNNTDSELVIYGRIPLMVSAQCLKKSYSRCTKNDPVLYLKDRKNYTYPVYADCAACRNTIYNPFPLSLLSKKEEVKELGAGSYRFIFTDETPEMIRRRIGAWVSEDTFREDYEFTRGHFGRGI